MTIKTEPVTLWQVNAIKRVLGFASSLFVNDIDYSKGRGILSEFDRCLWTRKGHRITISALPHGGFIASQSLEIDPELPSSIYPVINANLFKCIKPECDVTVDRRKRKSGACCKEHMSYNCTHPKCLKRAADNGWSRCTHAYGSEIARKHMQWRSGQG